jgi:preprotein translocase subunit Sss1
LFGVCVVLGLLLVGGCGWLVFLSYRLTQKIFTDVTAW